MDYKDLGLDSQLKSVNSLANSSYVPAYDFVTDNERGAVTRGFMGHASVGTAEIIDASITNAKLGTAVIGTANIGTLSFNEISGGTANLGGTTNGNGVLSVKNQAGSEVVKLDSSGVTVTNGSITIQNSSGSNVIDSNGLVGALSFPQYSSFIDTQFNTTSTTYVDITNVTQTTGSYSRGIPTLMFYSARLKTEGSNGVAFEGYSRISLNLDGAIPNDFVHIDRYGYRDTSSPNELSGNLPITLDTHYSSSPGTGTHVYKMQAKIVLVSGTPALTVYHGRLTVLTLGA